MSQGTVTNTAGGIQVTNLLVAAIIGLVIAKEIDPPWARGDFD